MLNELDKEMEKCGLNNGQTCTLVRSENLVGEVEL